MKQLITIFLLCVLLDGEAATQKKRLSTERVWMEIEKPITLFDQYAIDIDATASLWNEDAKAFWEEHPRREILGIDLDGDGDQDYLYTSWIHNGRLGKIMEWYTINGSGKHYGWIKKRTFDDGSTTIEMSSEPFELHLDWKTIRMPFGDREMYGLLSHGGFSHGYYGYWLVNFEKIPSGGYGIGHRLLMLTQMHSDPNNPPDIRTYDDGFKTMLADDSMNIEEYVHEKIGQYILTPEGEDSYEVVNSFNVYEAIKKAVEEKRQKDAASKKSAKETKTIKQPVPAPVKQTITTTETQPRQPVTKTEEPTQSDNNLFWLILAGIAGLIGV